MPQRRTLSLALLCLVLQTAWGWNHRWISMPRLPMEAQTLFRRTYHFDTRPDVAHISVADQGQHILYVNGYAVATDALTPGELNVGRYFLALERTYDVARFLHAGDNTIALWHSPQLPGSHVACPEPGAVALSFYGHTLDGQPFSYSTDGTWLCRPVPGTTEWRGETYDGTLFDPSWKGDETLYPAWTGAQETANDSLWLTREDRQRCAVVETLSPIYSYEQDDGTLVYQFPKIFCGWVRLTLRGMRRGAVVWAGSVRYACTGVDDEQCCPRFSRPGQREVRVRMSEGKPADHITCVEALAISTRPWTGWGW